VLGGKGGLSVHRKVVTAALVPLLVAACTTAPTKRDALCQQLQQFADSVSPEQTRTVVLRGGWGGESPNALMTHSCDHAGYEPGGLFCEYLIEHTSWEFGKNNARRAALCLNSTDQAGFLASLEGQSGPEELRGHLASHGTSGAVLTIRFEPNEISKLVISVVGGRR
jgi:hypothetical protein